MATRSVTTTYIQATPQIFAATTVPPVSTPALTVSTTFLAIDNPPTDVE